MRVLSRRSFAVPCAATFASLAVVRAPARAAQFVYKMGTDQSDFSPTVKRALEMWQAIERETGGRLAVQTFPNSVLGGDTQMITQLRSGALQFLTMVGGLLGNVVPASSIDEVAFAFKDPAQAFAATDGELGDFIRKEIQAKGMVCIPKPWDNGFRHVTANKPIRTVADVEGLKIRVPAAPLFFETWKTLGASPTPINVSELYSALATHVVEAQENALVNIEQSKLYEVQKTLNLSNHAWSCWWFLANKEAWDALGADIQSVVTRNVAKYASLQRRDYVTLTASLTGKLKEQGMQVYPVDVSTFRAKLGGYYARWRREFGPTAWSLLEKYAGALG